MPDSTTFRITGFADEVSPDLDVQIHAFKNLRLAAIDVRSVSGVNVLDLSREELATIRSTAAEDGVGIQCVGSPVNKVFLTLENRPIELEKLKRAIAAADVLGVRRIRIFTPETAEQEHESRANEVLDWMSEQIDLAKASEVVLLHENDAKFWGAYPSNAKRLFSTLGSDNFKAAFDFANTVLIGFRPLNDWFPWILPHLDTLHIKDAIQADRKVVPAGHGDGQMVETLRFLLAAGWNGPLTLEPHLTAAGKFGGFSGAQLFATAAGALRDVLREVGAKG